MPEKRKQRAYISSILAKHEINRDDLYNKRLFLRVMRGYYILNPDLCIKGTDAWTNVYTLLDLETVKENILIRLSAMHEIMAE